MINIGLKRLNALIMCIIIGVSTLLVACDKEEVSKDNDVNYVTQGSNGEKMVLKVASPNYLHKTDAVDFERFEFLNPTIDIQMTDYSGWFHDTEKLQLFSKKLNLDLLAGVNLDIIEVSSINIDKYVDKKYLLELNDLMDQDEKFKYENFYPNIMEDIKYGESFYFMPREIYPILYYVNEEESRKLDWEVDDHYMSWEQFTDYAITLDESGEDSYLFLSQKYVSFILDIIKCNYNEFITEDGTVEMDALIPMLKDMEEITKLVHPRATDMYSIMNKSKVVMNSELWFTPLVYTFIKYMMGTRDIDYTRVPNLNNDLESYPYDISIAYAISATSQHQEEAWEFLRHSITYRNKKEIEQMANLLGNRAEMEYCYNLAKVDRYALSIIPKVEVEEYYDILAYYDNLNNLVRMDIVIENLIVEEINNYVNGFITVEDMIQNIENKVNIYINE
ncbi:ABC transporter substrate-binding protein [Vallitalea okinawensis]|uniref:ABC transporter substrate-binding protein n=1 Tax=Vallitalea okinawensis TaxID=2078660 RepID=UPI000CFDC823|nr:extracellular solute-binding protein [Vallitalea okinawensis]